jgi:methionyl aminopeptidase
MIRLKNAKQIEGIRESCRLLRSLYDELLPKIKAGMTTAEVNDFCHRFMTAHGGTPAWFREDFPTAACVSINEAVIHGLPSHKRRLKNGDLLSIDTGIDFRGFISDAAVTVPVGGPSAVSSEARRLLAVTHECLWAGIGACRPGNRISDITKAVYDIATKAGFGVVHEYCGHGVGLEVHEDPTIPFAPGSRNANPRIQAGMVLAIEPMINAGTGDVDLLDDGWTVVTADRRLSCHEEHTVVVFADRTEVLTA